MSEQRILIFALTQLAEHLKADADRTYQRSRTFRDADGNVKPAGEGEDPQDLGYELGYAEGSSSAHRHAADRISDLVNALETK